MAKPFKVVSYVSINGEYVLFDSLDPELKRKIGIELNERAMKAAGYVRVEKTEDTTA